MHDLRVVEGSRTHAEVLYLKHMFGATDEAQAVEAAIRLQAELVRLLDHHTQVRLWGGPPFGSLRWFGSVNSQQCGNPDLPDG